MSPVVLRVEQLLIKTQRGDPLQPRPSLRLCRGVGIEGDRNAQIGSPRQVLVVSRSVLDAFSLTVGDLQENILLDGLVEQFTSGQVLRIGATAQLYLTYLCEPCARLERIRPGLARSLRGQRGFLAVVTGSGQISVGDAVQLSPQRFPAWPDRNRDRFEMFVSRIPPGHVVRTSDLVLAMGWTSGFYRVLPTFIKTAPATLPVHRIVTLDGSLLEKYLPAQAQQLAAEGVESDRGRVDAAYLWSAENFQYLDTDSNDVESAR